MAWHIVQYSKEPGQRSRLWNPEDCYHVLKNKAVSVYVRLTFVHEKDYMEIFYTHKSFSSGKFECLC